MYLINLSNIELINIEKTNKNEINKIKELLNNIKKINKIVIVEKKEDINEKIKSMFYSINPEMITYSKYILFELAIKKKKKLGEINYCCEKNMTNLKMGNCVIKKNEKKSSGFCPECNTYWCKEEYKKTISDRFPFVSEINENDKCYTEKIIEMENVKINGFYKENFKNKILKKIKVFFKNTK